MSQSGYNVEFLSADELLNIKKPDALITGFIQEWEAVLLWGAPNGGKSFLALDWALSIATGLPWLGIHEVKKGPVLYMAGEGAPSLQRRVRAWCDYHEVERLSGAWFQVRPLPIREEDVIDDILVNLQTFAEKEQGEGDRAKLRTRLIVVDTLSQFFGGGDENGPDMAQFVNNLRRLSQDHETAVLIVHHSRKDDGTERGHTALRGNIDVGFRCVPVQNEHGQIGGITVLNDKQRDSAKQDKLVLKLKLVTYGQEDDDNSLVVVPTVVQPERTLPRVSHTLLKVLEAMLNTEDADKERCHNRIVAQHLNKSVPAIHDNLDSLAGLKLVKHGERGYSSLTTLGRLVLDKAGITREEPEEEDK